VPSRFPAAENNDDVGRKAAPIPADSSEGSADGARKNLSLSRRRTAPEADLQQVEGRQLR